MRSRRPFLGLEQDRTRSTGWFRRRVRQRGRRPGVVAVATVVAVALSVSGLAVPAAWADPVPSISGQVWSNLNGNAVQEANEPGLASIAVQLVGAGPDGVLDTADDVVFADQTTDASGNYAFSNLTAGRYRVQLNSATVPASKVLTAGTSPLVVDLGAAEQRTVGFGLSDNGSISGAVYSDSNGNGTPDAGEAERSGARVSLVGAGPDGLFGTGDDVVFPDASTSSSGGYTFSNLSPDSYRVTLAPAAIPMGQVLTRTCMEKPHP